MQLNINDEKIRNVLSKNIKFSRLSSELTQDALAEDANISLSFLKDVESAKSGTSLLNLINICKALNTTPNQLLKDFFKDSLDKSEHIEQQINLLTDYQKDAVLTLIQYFITHEGN